MKTPVIRLLFGLFAGAALAALGITEAYATKAGAPKPAAASKNELAAAAEMTAQHGLHAELPPHVSTLLGLALDRKCVVLRGVVRAAGSIQGFEITEKNHNDIVIFVVDQKTSDQTFYLTAPNGALRKLLSVKQGVGHLIKPTVTDQKAFEKEKKMWEEQLAAK